MGVPFSTLPSALPPIVNQVDARPVVARLVVPLHPPPLKVCAEPPLQHLAIGFVTSRVDAGCQAGQTLFSGQLFTGVKQPVEVLPRGRTQAHRTEFDVARSTASFSARPAVTDCQPGQSPVVPEEHGITKTLFRNGAHLRPHIQSLVDSVGYLTAGEKHPLPLALRHFGESRPPGLASCLSDRFGHDRGEEARPEAESLIEADVLLALREGKETGVFCPPLVKILHKRVPQT